MKIVYLFILIIIVSCGGSQEKENLREYDEIPQPMAISYEDLHNMLEDDSTWTKLDNRSGEIIGRQKVLGDLLYKEARMSILFSQRFHKKDTTLQVIPLSAQGIAKTYDVPMSSKLYTPEDTVLYFTEGCFHLQQRKPKSEGRSVSSWKKVCLN